MLNIKKMLKDDSGFFVIPNWIGALASLMGCLVTIGDICGTHIIAPCIDGVCCIGIVETLIGLDMLYHMFTECGVDTLLRCFGK